MLARSSSDGTCTKQRSVRECALSRLGALKRWQCSPIHLRRCLVRTAIALIPVALCPVRCDTYYVQSPTLRIRAAGALYQVHVFPVRGRQALTIVCGTSLARSRSDNSGLTIMRWCVGASISDHGRHAGALLRRRLVHIQPYRRWR